MKFYLIGNGFDLYHRLPTKYNNFLHTIDFLVNHYEESMDTVGKVFGDPRLQEQDAWIKLCYETHKKPFDATPIDTSQINATIHMAKENIWFRYLLNSYNRDIGWIDFEKEVSTVVNAFDSFFTVYPSCISVDAALDKIGAPHDYIINQFGFFIEENHAITLLRSYSCYINDDYLTEYPLHSHNYELDTEKIVKALFDSLVELGVMLREYLLQFVEKVADCIFTVGLVDYAPFLSDYNSRVITFNYTNIYEKLCKSKEKVCHIHGNIAANIVLGINPTKADETQNIDTTFLRFKKYYQRVLNETDTDYLSAIASIRSWKGKGGRNHLTVFGHSLDRTDEDVIKECFDASEHIIVYYYGPDFHSTVRNLVSIFGKQEFDRLRREKSLTFKPQPTINWEAYKNVQLQLPPL